MREILVNLTEKRLKSASKSYAFLDSIESGVKQNYKATLAKKMITNRRAPDFTMLDLEGKKVTLSELKGKVVVLDFWATWCAPCISSMPAVKEVSQAHPEVAFLFIASLEKAKDAVFRVNSFVKKNGFPLSVLMDSPLNGFSNDFPVASAYKITAIPTKIVIDKKGEIRFLSQGFNNDVELIRELDAMIEIASAQ